MLLREILIEKALQPAELAKHSGKYLVMLINFIKAGTPLPIDPAFRDVYGDSIVIDKAWLPTLSSSLDSGDIAKTVPKKIDGLINGKKVMIPMSALFKGAEFTGAEGKKPYNSGHLAELFMGVCVASKFIAGGNPIKPDTVLNLINNGLATAIDGKNYTFKLTQAIKYPKGGKQDSLNFLARVPARSAEAFINQAKSGQFVSDLNAIFTSTIKYCNESSSVADSCNRVKNDPNNNQISVISDGTTDAKGTKADLTLSIDGSKVNLLSLKTYGSDTLGQYSGLGLDNLKKWFMINFGFDIMPFADKFSSKLTDEKKYANLLSLYDKVIHPYVVGLVEGQSPGKEAQIVKQFAKAANIYARGEKLEDVEIVKLDDTVSTGSYKILRFSDNLKDAMKHLDLDVKYVGGGQGRTIQIWVKPAKGEKVGRGTNKLCQFRTQKMGDSYRNYFESGPMLEELTAIDAPLTDKPVAAKLTKGANPISVGKTSRKVKAGAK